MSNLVIATPELSDAASLTASSAVAAAPIDNLQRMQPTDIWQSASLTPYIEIDLGSAQAFNLVALLFTNATIDATWRVRAATSQANLTASPGYDSSTTTFSPWTTYQDRRHGFLFLSPAQTYRWIRIDLSDASNPDGVLSAGRLYVANAYQPTRNFDYGHEWGWIDRSTRDRIPAGPNIVNRQGVVPWCSFNIGCNSEAELYANAQRIDVQRAGSRDVLLILDPDDAVNGHEKIYYGLLEATRRIRQPRYNLFETRYELEGLI